jgi:hypothetical protein
MATNVKNKSSMDKIQIENILLRFKLGQRTLDESTKEILRLFDVSESFCDHKWEHYLPEYEIQICKKCISLRFTE